MPLDEYRVLEHFSRKAVIGVEDGKKTIYFYKDEVFLAKFHYASRDFSKLEKIAEDYIYGRNRIKP